MAGSEKAGASAAKASLFKGAICILTPMEKTDIEALEIVDSLWRTVGANVKIMSPAEHDFLIAAASHLPHLTACALVQTVGKIENSAGKALDMTATGFRDTTRIASGSPDLWKGILMENADMLIPMVEQLIGNLEIFKNLLMSKDESTIEKMLKHAKEIRQLLHA